MANKKTGGQYHLTEGVRRGWYYFAKYYDCSCGKRSHVFLHEYEAQEFVHNAWPWLDRRTLFEKLKERLPIIKIVVGERGGD